MKKSHILFTSAGGRKVFADLQDDSGKTSVAITMEEFYNTAADADYLIYNSSIDASVKSIDDLLAKESLMADFKAVKEGNVWVTEDLRIHFFHRQSRSYWKYNL